jgi:pyrimidine deaminase RibD-like protein
MEEIKLNKPTEEVRDVLKHYLNNGHKFTDTPSTDPGLADYEVKFKKWSADAAGSIRRCFDPPAVAERFSKVPRRKGTWREAKVQTRYRNLIHAYEYQRDFIKELKGTLGIYESPKSDNPERQFMIRAIELSRNCKDESDRPSPKVGAVLVKQGKIIGEAYRGELRPGDHAEYTLLQKKLETEIVAGSTLYVTLEPCTKRGPNKTPCAERIIERKIKKVVFGCIDRNPNIRGEGELQLMDAGIEIGKFDSDLLPIIEELNRDFLRIHRTNKTRRTAVETMDPVEAGAVGPNGYEIGYTEKGDKVEWLPDEENPGKRYPMILRRNDKTILEAYDEFWDKVWWNRHQNWLSRIESGEEPQTEEQKALLKTAEEAAKRIEDKYGRENLGWDDFEWGMLQGRMSALSWVMGSEWEESLDT